MNRPIYLDHQATTPIDPAVLEAMMPYLTDKFGNAASRTHRYGWEAEEAVHTAREQIAALIGAKPEEIVLTSGATESDNLALKGIAWAYRDKGNHIITTTTEHKAVLDSCKALEKDGFNVTYVPVDRMGLVDPDDIRRAMTPRTTLISVMYVNSEIGAIGPFDRFGLMVHINLLEKVRVLQRFEDFAIKFLRQINVLDDFIAEVNAQPVGCDVVNTYYVEKH